MTVVVLIGVAILIILVIGLYRNVEARFFNLSERLTRIENALGGEDWVEFLHDLLPGSHPEEVERTGIVGRVERIEAALDPIARARLDVKRRMRELDEALKKDPSEGYVHWQASKIQELVERGERPDRAEWESWIGTPFPWA
jgi:hypothetical protein